MNFPFLNAALMEATTAKKLEASGETEAALSAFKDVVTNLSQSLKQNELQKQHLVEELQNEIQEYTQKISELSKKVHKKPVPEPCQSDDNLKTRIEQTILVTQSTVKLHSVVGLQNVKTLLEQALVLPVTQPQIFGNNLVPYKSFLFYGPPGTGKSHLARAVAGECRGSTFFSVSAADLTSKYMGESEGLIKQLFQLARSRKPSIIFIDEIDSLAMSRRDSDSTSSRRITSELFIQMEGATSDNSGVFVVAATNTPQNLDSAMLRRFDKLVYVPLPDRDAREEMFQKGFSDSPQISDTVCQDMASKSAGLSGSDIAKLVKTAKMTSISRLQSTTQFVKVVRKGEYHFIPCAERVKGSVRMKLSEVPTGRLLFQASSTKKDALHSLANAKTTTNPEMIRGLERFADEFGDGVDREVEVQYKPRFPENIISTVLNFF